MNFLFGNETLTIVMTEYWDGNTAVQIVDSNTGEPWGTISVNMPQSKALPKGTFYIKDWSENKELAYHMYSLGILARDNTVPPANNGFITAYAGRIVTK